MALNPSTNIKMVGRITPASPDYPYGSSKDETSAGANDGTPYFEGRANDSFGFQQALLTAAGIAPSGNAETALVSQYLQALQTLFAGVESGWFNWAAKDAAYTAVSGDGILADTSGGAFTVTLPATPSVGDRVAIVDATGSFTAENCTVERNSSLIEGVAANRVLSFDRYAVSFVFSGVLEGWVIVSEAATEFGRGQAWQDVTLSRALNVVYTNTTGRPIFISVALTGSFLQELEVDGVPVARLGDAAGNDGNFMAVIPDGSTYEVTPDGVIAIWAELR